MARTRLKVCCIASVDEARRAVAAGADALGLVSAMPSGPGPIEDECIREIAATVPPPVATFLLTCRTRGDAIVEQLRFTRCNTVQLCDAVEDGAYDAIRAALPAVKIVQVIHVEDEVSLDEAHRASRHVDALLLDSGRPKAETKELGGTGRVHDWTLSRRIVGTSPVPVFLAGGLRAENVRRAVTEVAPYGLDVCSGVRTAGHLDDEKLRALVEAVNASAR
jgi:phosphoribosylanthranilate isomerase